MLVRLMTLAERSSRPRELEMLHGFAVLALTDATGQDPRLAPLLALPGLSAALRSQGERDGWIDERFDARQALQWCAPYGGQ